MALSRSERKRELLTLPFFSEVGSLLIRQMPTESVPYAYFENEIPSDRQRRAILDGGFGLHINGVPVAHGDLDFIRSYVGITHLDIVGGLYDPLPIASLASVIDLRLVREGRVPLDLSRMPLLETFTGSLMGNESVFRAPRVRKIGLEDVEGALLPSIPNQLEELNLMSAKNIREILAGGSSPRLRSLTLYGSRIFDMASLAAFPLLDRVMLERVSVIQGASALSEASWEALSLRFCGRVEDPQALASAPIRKVWVVGKLCEVFELLRKNPASTWELSKR